MMTHARMRTIWIFGFERWGDLRPAWCVRPNGDLFVPVWRGLWIRRRKGKR